MRAFLWGPTGEFTDKEEIRMAPQGAGGEVQPVEVRLVCMSLTTSEVPSRGKIKLN